MNERAHPIARTHPITRTHPIARTHPITRTQPITRTHARTQKNAGILCEHTSPTATCHLPPASTNLRNTHAAASVDVSSPQRRRRRTRRAERTGVGRLTRSLAPVRSLTHPTASQPRFASLAHSRKHANAKRGTLSRATHSLTHSPVRLPLLVALQCRQCLIGNNANNVHTQVHM